MFQAGPGASRAVVPVVRPQRLPAGTIDLLLQRGLQAFRNGDVSGARLLLGRAAAAESAHAATAMGWTFDPAFLAEIGARIAPDPAKAAEWYRRAAALGSDEAAALLHQLEQPTRSRP